MTDRRSLLLPGVVVVAAFAMLIALGVALDIATYAAKPAQRMRSSHAY